MYSQFKAPEGLYNLDKSILNKLDLAPKLDVLRDIISSLDDVISEHQGRITEHPHIRICRNTFIECYKAAILNIDNPRERIHEYGRVFTGSQPSDFEKIIADAAVTSLSALSQGSKGVLLANAKAGNFHPRFNVLLIEHLSGPTLPAAAKSAAPPPPDAAHV